MTTADAGNPGRAHGFRLDQLKEAFERVCDPRHWKAPIRAVIPAVERLLVEKAVRWFAETEPRFEEVPGDGTLLMVLAPGYRGKWTESPDGSHST